MSEPRKITRPHLKTHRSVIGRPLAAGPGCPIACQSAKPLAVHFTEHPSRCAHGSGRGDYTTPSRPRRTACAGGAACVTAVSASGTESNQLRPFCDLLTCPVGRGGGACSGLSAPQEPRHSCGYPDTTVFFFVCFVFTCVCLLAAFWRNERRMFGS